MTDSLKPQWFHILLALSETDRHGYGIQRAVKELTNGNLMLWPGMLYRSLDELAKRGWIQAVPDPNDEPDERRQYYRITTAGRQRLAAEAETLASWADLARTRTS